MNNKLQGTQECINKIDNALRKMWRKEENFMNPK
jgi:hypothetical protein